jgi:hypothetical protein
MEAAMELRKSTLLCVELPRHDTGTYYAHFSRHIFTLKCYDKTAAALVAEVVEDPSGDYWAWWDNKEVDFSHVYPHDGLVEMCFPYGTKPEIEKGKGHKVRVRITILREAGPLDREFRKNKAL